MNYLLPDWIYNIAKWAGLILCPALAALIGKAGPAWGLPNVDAIGAHHQRNWRLHRRGHRRVAGERDGQL